MIDLCSPKSVLSKTRTQNYCLTQKLVSTLNETCEMNS